MLRSNTQQQQQPQPPPVAQACLATVEEMSAPSLEAQPTSTASVQAPNANSSSLNDMFKEVVMAFQQIMTELNGAESEEARVVAITKILLKLMKKNVRCIS
jgi:hypothetical protein